MYDTNVKYGRKSLRERTEVRVETCRGTQGEEVTGTVQEERSAPAYSTRTPAYSSSHDSEPSDTPLMNNPVFVAAMTASIISGY